MRGEIIPKAAGRARGQLGQGMLEASQIHGDRAGASSCLAHCARAFPTFVFLELQMGSEFTEESFTILH